MREHVVIKLQAKMVMGRAVVGALALVSLAGVANAQAAAPPCESKSYAPLTPFTSVIQNSHASIQIPPEAYSDAYTRILLTSFLQAPSIFQDTCPNAAKQVDPSPQTEAWAYQGRHWWERVFVAKEFLVNVTLKVSANQFKATIPIATFDHKSSNGVGEQWERKIYHSVESYPLFLVGATGEGGTPSIDLEFNGSDTLNSQLASTAVSAVFDVAKELGPQSKLVTSLSQASIEKQASVLDSAVSKIFGKSVSEGHQADTDLRFTHYGEAMYFHIRLPKTEDSFNTTTHGADPIDTGTWIVSFEEPRPSVFVDWRICGKESDNIPRCKETRSAAVKAVYQDVDAATVLRTQLASTDNGLGQIGAYLSQLDWYKAAIPKLSQINATPAAADTAAGDTSAAAAPAKAAKGAPKPVKTVAKPAPGPAASPPAAGLDSMAEVNSEFCLKINNTFTQLGLTTVDAGIVVWAVYSAMPDIPQNARQGLASDPTCKKWISAVTSAKS